MEDFDFAIFNNMIQRRGKDEGVFARFYPKFVKTGVMLESGLPEYKERLYIEIRMRGCADITDRAADDNDLRRFAQEYAFYQAKKEKMKTGTPLNQFAFLSAPQIEACNLRGICTVEDLANITDDQAKALNLTDEKKCAVKFLEMSKDNAVIKKYEEENARLKEKIAKLEDELKALQK
ncbi:MAG: hypothetical protein IJS26_05500 [Alphaproteobacteria bacterium]|nr:hypothetical protein [Alphaproteobacteria bacterium]